MEIDVKGFQDDTELNLNRTRLQEKIDERFNFFKPLDSFEKIGWLINMHTTCIMDENKRLLSAVDYYFIQNNGNQFKISLHYPPYFYLMVKSNHVRDTASFLNKKYTGVINDINIIFKEDLDMKPDHLIGRKGTFLKLSFLSISDLMKVRNSLMPIIRKNKDKKDSLDVYSSYKNSHDDDAPNRSNDMNIRNIATNLDEMFSHILDMREYDVPYYIRVSIDLKIFVGHWYNVKGKGGFDNIYPEITLLPDIEERPEPIIIAFDIETTKAPLKFPDQSFDQIMMISYVIDGQGYLITNRQIVSRDIDDFEYNPKPEFEGFFTIFNEIDELATLKRFFKHILDIKPHVFVTYNGDGFDWPFIKARAQTYGIDMYEEIGFFEDSQKNYISNTCIHMDCFKWVKRDSYLPVGSQGLKAVAKIKLDYHPSELDPEKMCTMAIDNPQVLASYSVSDALATYYLYIKYIHSFIFSLCTIVPMDPDDVLRKGSGTLCETLLMVQAYHANIIYPNKHSDYGSLDYDFPLNNSNNKNFMASSKKGSDRNNNDNDFNTNYTQRHHNRYKYTKDGFLIEQETYIGGHVEAIESGVFRSDILLPFKIDIKYIKDMINNVENIIKNTIEYEEEIPITQIINFKEVCDEISSTLYTISKTDSLNEAPKIYHLDVGAMYPNIILTNRLQPYAVVNETTCAKCTFNVAGSDCQRPLNWKWRGEHMPINKTEAQRISLQLENETFVSKQDAHPNNSDKVVRVNDNPNGSKLYDNKFTGSSNIRKPFHELPKEQRMTIEKQRLKEYSRKVYKKLKITREEEKTSVTCQRENSFYIDTIRAFRDRRYDFKNMVKFCNKKIAALKSNQNQIYLTVDPDNVNNANENLKDLENKKILYDSLQLAHKCILNSFYGYVMRKGARWFSMEMAGIVCLIGSLIIKEARSVVEKIGRPLELDTDGIWCALPSSFPENFTFITLNAKKPKIIVSFVGALLNLMVQEKFTNRQYQVLVDDKNFVYQKRDENSIFFEVDGPYHAMILPSSKEEGKKLKKRYAVFNMDKSLAEMKGFEVKRRGELPFLKIFQNSVFEAALKGNTLEEIYRSLANVADYWLDFLYSKGADMSDEEIFDLIAENKNMSKKLDEYGAKKSTSISTAKRLAEFLGDQMIKDKGLNCCYIIAKKPDSSPLSERAIPYVIFQADEKIKRHYLKKWLKVSQLVQNENGGIDIKDIVDWDYYIERISSAIQKIITIPAAMQYIKNPVPRVPHPEWLHKKLVSFNDVFKQKKISDMFSPQNSSNSQNPELFLPLNRKRANVSGEIEIVDIEDIGSLTKRQVINNINDYNKNNDAHLDITDSNNNNPDFDTHLDTTNINNINPKEIAIDKSKKKIKPSKPLYKRDKFWKGIIGVSPVLNYNQGNFTSWLNYHKSKWRIQLEFRKREHNPTNSPHHLSNKLSKQNPFHNLTQKNNNRIYNYPWHVIQVMEMPNEPGIFKVWAIIDKDLTCLKLVVPRIFYVNQYIPKSNECTNKNNYNNQNANFWEKVSRILPKNQTSHFVYKYRIPENIYQEFSQNLEKDLSSPHIEGVYETQVPLLFRVYVELGCLWQISFKHRLQNNLKNITGNRKTPANIYTHNFLGSFELDQLKRCEDLDKHHNRNNNESSKSNGSKRAYLPPGSVTYIYLYHHSVVTNKRGIWALCLPTLKKTYVYFYDTSIDNKSKNVSKIWITNAQAESIYQNEREIKLNAIKEYFDSRDDTNLSNQSIDGAGNKKQPTTNIEYMLPYPDHVFEINKVYGSEKTPKIISKNTVQNTIINPNDPKSLISSHNFSSFILTKEAIKRSLKHLIKQHSQAIDELKSDNNKTIPENTILAYHTIPSLQEETIDLYSTSSNHSDKDQVQTFLKEISLSYMPCIRILPSLIAGGDFDNDNMMEGEDCRNNDDYKKSSSSQDWHKTALVKMIRHYLDSSRLLDALLEESRYLEIPLGNLSQDLPLLGADVNYSRRLTNNGCVLWASLNDKPDLGGKENDDNYNLCDDSFETDIDDTNGADYVINNPGFYNSICLEIQISGLPTNSLLSYHRILENEGVAPALSFSTSYINNNKNNMTVTLRKNNFKDSVELKNLKSQNLSAIIDDFNKDYSTLDRRLNNSPCKNDTFNDTTFVEAAGYSGFANERNLGSNTWCHDDMTSNSESFRLLRCVIQSWVKDAARDDNLYARNQLLHFYRWLRSPKSLLYDPSIKKALQLFIKKLFLSLTRELKKLGASIVYANYNRMIICSKRHKLSKAFSYIAYLLKVLRDHILFHGLNLKIECAWDVLMWLGPSDYGGIKTKMSPEIFTDFKREIFSESFIKPLIFDNDAGKNSHDDQKVVMNWNLARYLVTNPNCQYYFNIIVALYIMSVYDYMQQESTLNKLGAFKTAPKSIHLLNDGLDNLDTLNDLESQENNNTESNNLHGIHITSPGLLTHCQNLIKTEITEKLFKILQKVQRLSENYASINNESSSPTHKNIKNAFLKEFTNNNEQPALSLTKSICHVLSLDTNISTYVDKLKRNLLKLLQVGEFSDQAEYSDVRLTFILREVICDNCYFCRDLDICRDINIEEENKELNWECINCPNFLNKDMIEGMLIKVTKNKLMKYVLQDLVCQKCQEIKEANIVIRCTCNGSYKFVLSSKRLVSVVKAFIIISKHFKMDSLQDMLCWISKYLPTQTSVP